MKKIALLVFVSLFGLGTMAAMGEPGDLLQTFLNPRPTTRQVRNNFWVRSPLAAVGENLVIGFPEDDTLGIDAGKACLFDPTEGTILQTFKSPKPGVGHNFGCSVAAVGNRVVIGEYRASEPDSKYVGAAHIFDGATGELLYTLSKPSLAAGDYFGSVVCALGENFAVRCPGDDTAARNSGAVFLYGGSDGELLQVFQKPNPAANDGFGRALAAVGDNLLVADDLDDTKGPNAGAVYLMDGSTGELLRTFFNPGLGRGHGFGQALAALGDNVLIAEKSFRPTRAEGGIVYLFDGATGELLQTFQNPNPVVEDGFGQSVTVVGGNVLVGANHAHANGLNVGAAYLFNASSGQLLHTFLNPTPGWNDLFGVRVAALGNNVVIAATLDDTAGIDAGAVYLFEGGSSADFAARQEPVTLNKTSRTRLYVRTTPPGAKVFLDGQPIGISDGLFIVQAGTYQIAVEKAGFSRQTQPVKVDEGQVARLEVTLQKP